MADFFTKPLSGESFFRMRNAIMNHPPRTDSAALALQSRTRATKRVSYQCAFCGGMGHQRLCVCALRRPRLRHRACTSRSICGGGGDVSRVSRPRLPHVVCVLAVGPRERRLELFVHQAWRCRAPPTRAHPHLQHRHSPAPAASPPPA
eukprot:1043298-Prymnesium_polylepis.1